MEDHCEMEKNQWNLAAYLIKQAHKYYLSKIKPLQKDISYHQGCLIFYSITLIVLLFFLEEAFLLLIPDLLTLLLIILIIVNCLALISNIKRIKDLKRVISALGSGDIFIINSLQKVILYLSTSNTAKIISIRQSEIILEQIWQDSFFSFDAVEREKWRKLFPKQKK